MGGAARLTVLASLVSLCASAGTTAGEMELVERLPGAIDDHTIVMLDASRAVVAWERDDGPAHETVWSSRRLATGRWSVPEILEFSQGHSGEVQLATDGNGAVTAIWVQQELFLSGLWANRYLPDEGWQQPVRVEPVAGELYAPHLALDTRGHGFAVWERRRGNRLGVRVSRYTPESGWEPPRDIDAGNGEATSPRLAVHSDGHAMAAWSRRDNTGKRLVVAARFRPGEGWSPPEAISTMGGDAYDAQVAMDAAANSIVSWQQKIHGEETILARRFEPGTGWSAAVQLETNREEGYGPRLAVSPDGSALVAWIRADGEAGTIVVAHYTHERGWESPVTIQGGELLYVFDLQVAATVNGSALATWCQTDGLRNNVWYARFDPGSGWRPAVLAEKRTGSAHRPIVAVGPEGHFGLLWKTVDAPLPEQALYSLWFRLVP